MLDPEQEHVSSQCLTHASQSHQHTPNNAACQLAPLASRKLSTSKMIFENKAGFRRYKKSHGDLSASGLKIANKQTNLIDVVRRVLTLRRRFLRRHHARPRT